ncbi:hypothetical protein NQZ68_001745 [Dissostichus eleginoides]|nr:hypothetical protein NQZ68_001745 [Dissostichus eleginoides]
MTHGGSSRVRYYRSTMFITAYSNDLSQSVATALHLTANSLPRQGHVCLNESPADRTQVKPNQFNGLFVASGWKTEKVFLMSGHPSGSVISDFMRATCVIWQPRPPPPPPHARSYAHIQDNASLHIQGRVTIGYGASQPCRAHNERLHQRTHSLSAAIQMGVWPKQVKEAAHTLKAGRVQGAPLQLALHSEHQRRRERVHCAVECDRIVPFRERAAQISSEADSSLTGIRGLPTRPVNTGAEEEEEEEEEEEDDRVKVERRERGEPVPWMSEVCGARPLRPYVSRDS